MSKKPLLFSPLLQQSSSAELVMEIVVMRLPLDMVDDLLVLRMVPMQYSFHFSVCGIR